LRRLNTVYKEYGNTVAFLAIDVDPSEHVDIIRSFKETEGYTWYMASADPQVLRDFDIKRQSSKIIIDSRGIIVSRKNSIGDSEKSWRDAFESLAHP